VSAHSKGRLVGAGIVFAAAYLWRLLGFSVAWFLALTVALLAAQFVLSAFPQGQRLGPTIFCVLVALIGATVWVIVQDPFGAHGSP
jgi:FtsH-binding integral membrane protein